MQTESLRVRAQICREDDEACVKVAIMFKCGVKVNFETKKDHTGSGYIKTVHSHGASHFEYPPLSSLQTIPLHRL